MNTAVQQHIERCRQNNFTSLELRGEEVDDEVLAHLHGHKHLKELHIVAAGKVTNAGLTYLENLQNLEWLNLDAVAINDKGLFFLQQMSRLKGLQLTNAFLTGCGIEHLLELKALEYLELDGTNVDDRCMQVLAKIKSLKTLRLCGTAVTDKGLYKLQRLKKLKTLFLYESRVSKESVQKLRKYMPKCEIRWSAYTPPKPVPAPLPPLFIHRQVPQWILQTLAPKEVPETAWDAGTFLKLVHEKHKLEIELKNMNMSRQEPSAAPRMTGLKPVPPVWFHLLDWREDKNP
ncbi:MAG: hypothetical protein U0103_26380 [Candidatus Obscuribacterales bacterium]